ncbi:tetratricopeptide repeat protein [Sphingomicrobium sediminis]|uniref:Tetratricopeptide repeat protein n=1 Tax=Sphingomicrobium sediminis TaxID=2950949 RepID=A0A9X2EHK9_9SPHN|nr:tetratricopeptide repeat protein [Sphingomicrobium sediminis]MCM8556831.1 tetratricopeptide repeat protein [Sphingomicrobium sediminis]
MKSTLTAIALALASTTMVAAPSAAIAQEEGKQIEVSDKARDSIFKAQEAVQAQNWAEAPALFAAVEPNIEKPDDRYYLGYLKLQMAEATGDTNTLMSALSDMEQSGWDPSVNWANEFVNEGIRQYNDENYEMARTLFNRALQSDPNYGEAYLRIGLSHYEEDNSELAFENMSRGIAVNEAAGAEVPETWYSNAISIAYNEGLAGGVPVAIKWAQAYPSAEVWRSVTRYYLEGALESGALSDNEAVDVYRLSRVAGALAGEYDYATYADALIRSAYGIEALSVLEEGAEVNAIDPTKVAFSQRFDQARKDAAADRAVIEDDAAAAMTAADALAARTAADSLYGAGEYQRAADLYRAALTKANPDTNLINLRLGMALVGMGDWAGAKAALDQVGGKYDTLADLWLAYVATQS